MLKSRESTLCIYVYINPVLKSSYIYHFNFVYYSNLSEHNELEIQIHGIQFIVIKLTESLLLIANYCMLYARQRKYPHRQSVRLSFAN